MKGYIHSIETFGTVDGPGVRYVIFLQGCPLRCLFCHNPDSWAMTDGKQMSVDELINDIKSYINYIKDGGVTLSGGEPLLQVDFITQLMKEIKNLGLHIAIDTAGSLPIEKTKTAIDCADLILLDIKGFGGNKNEIICGSPIKNTLDTLNYCESINKPVQIRQVLVKGYTLDDEYLHELGKFLKDFKCIQSVDLLPFHKMGEPKWEALKLDYKLFSTPATNRDELNRAKEILRSHGLKTI